ncbi:SDR family NAD(P)-dependent oxidoreductase [Plantactinospora sp. S1510]|uniref:SDR family NAD(P)-dependent oxidoreductase n=1 Tax=Plantactinospora alkalitolerans TaxID=2789879 RepID=A0ABS0H6F3_9ACTN|nr:oxidoreductase [Plantactinospora alkalitolerans]MBF9134044.1 SDR family NAD(P)-dependent oxidoreductase [Plantactinospora alkalitolerans]
MAHWTTADIPDQSGRVAVVTGANSGLGYQTALALARAGAHIVLACRDPQRGDAALDQLRTAAPDASAERGSLDLADLDSVRRFADSVESLDLLINNAGVMALPNRRTTAQGFEMQVGTNHLGHFALTGLLLPRLVNRPGARVVTVSSGLHRYGRLTDLDDLQSERRYRPWRAYALSKLANILFFTELDRRLRAANQPVRSLGAHPGYAATNLQSTGPGADGGTLLTRFGRLGDRVFAQSAAMGALPTLRAATEPDAQSGEYHGPSGFLEQRGYPNRVAYSSAGRDLAAAERLWTESERLTGVTVDTSTRG